MKLFDIEQLKRLSFTTITTNKKKTYINLELGLDIETTSTETTDGSKVAFMYIWTMGIQDEKFIFHGRTWGELISVFEQLQIYFDLNEDRILVCYVHNLSYEFQFIRKYLEWVNVFSVGDRKPIKALCTYGIEFRDSYILSGFSLSRLADNLMTHKIEKLSGDLDYTLIRHDETEMSPKEIDYCINDVVIILYYINEQMEMYGDITKIPLTNTGRVRSFVRHKCLYTNTNHSKSSSGKFRRYRQIMNDLQVTDTDYTMLKRAFMGGFTHANARETGKTLSGITSIDFSSSYPAVMLAEKFPMSKSIETEFTEEKGFEYYQENFCLLFDVRFTNITATLPYENYISESKCQNIKKANTNNGRIFSADEITMTITDVDFNIIKRCYAWETMEVANVKRYHKGYLPKDFIKAIIELYADKTTLKNVEGKEVEYVISKGMLNSTYGMTVTNIVRDEIIYTDDWGVEDADYKKQLDKYNKSVSRFLYYPWGVWITAYARRNLWSGIYAMGEDYVYSDTDAIKFKNYEKHVPYIENYNKLISLKLNKMCEHHKINPDLLSPKTNDGIVKPIGVWEIDGHYKQFKTLGAKRYIVEHENGKLESTVAGLSKRNGIEYMKRVCNNDVDKVFEMFNDKLYIPRDETGKMTHTYIDFEIDLMVFDYQKKEKRVNVRSGIHLEKCDFTLSLTEQYIQFIENLMKGYLYKGQKTI